VPLTEQLDTFWHAGDALAGPHINPLAGEAPDTLLRQLGPAPVQIAGENLVEILAPAYATLAEQAQQRALS
jgi:hypothetical protein